MLACSAMVACTNDDLLEDNNQQIVKNDSYLSIRLVNPVSSSRATFENGEANEGKISAARFYLFDANGGAYAIQDAQNLNVNYVSTTVSPGAPNQETGGNVETICNAVIVINKSQVAPPASIVAVLNPPTELGTSSLSLEQLQAANMAANYATIKTVGADGATVIAQPYIGENKFVMTNSVHIDDNNEMLVAVPIEAINIQTDADKAKAHPVQIYVERIASKVRVKPNTTGTNVSVNNNIVTIPTGVKDATGADITAQIKGWRVTNITESSNLLKSLSKSYTFAATGWTGWNDARNHRSYWANTTATPVHKWTFNDLTLSANGGYDYYNENTKNAEGSNSQLLVAAEFMVGGVKTTIAEWYGVKYTLEDLKTAIAGTLTKQIYVKDDKDALVSIPATNIDFYQETDNVTVAASKRYLSYATYLAKDANEAAIKYYNAAGTELTADDLKTIFKNVQPAKIWAAGGYYYVDIEHHSITEDVTEGEGEDAVTKTIKKSEKALVRNHLYDIKISALSGLGTPVYDPNKVITPEKPGTDDSFIAAQVNVLAWKVVSQDVTLQ